MTKIFFLLPKTAGTNLNTVISNNYPLKNGYIKKEHEQFILNGNHLFKELKPKNDEIIINRKTNKVETVSGHFAFQGCFMGWENPQIIILFRDPVERVISQYVQNKRNQSMDENFVIEDFFDNVPTELTPEIIKYAGFNGWHGNVPWTHDFYCNALSGDSVGSITCYPMTETICNQIIKNIQNRCVIFTHNRNNIKTPLIVGITEKFSLTLKYFANIFNWKTLVYKEMPVQKYRPGRRYDASEYLISQIKKNNTFDIRIYNAVLELFEKQLKG